MDPSSDWISLFNIFVVVRTEDQLFFKTLTHSKLFVVLNYVKNELRYHFNSINLYDRWLHRGACILHLIFTSWIDLFGILSFYKIFHLKDVSESFALLFQGIIGFDLIYKTHIYRCSSDKNLLFMISYLFLIYLLIVLSSLKL